MASNQGNRKKTKMVCYANAYAFFRIDFYYDAFKYFFVVPFQIGEHTVDGLQARSVVY